jgi:Methylase involved in ubiquinone/menaquinone biosynthesis
MNQSRETVQADFDRIALLSEETWSHNHYYHSYLMKKVPLHCKAALEIGCGMGAFSRLLAERADQVMALDLSPQMIRIAEERSKQHPNIHFEIADVITREFADEAFDCIVSIATLHHLPTEIMMRKIKRMLKVGGTFIALDLFRAEDLSDIAANAMAFPANIVLRLIKTGRLRQPYEIRQAWIEHGKTDSYLTMTEVREISANIFPGAEVKKHLFWRYSIIWNRIRD